MKADNPLTEPDGFEVAIGYPAEYGRLRYPTETGHFGWCQQVGFFILRHVTIVNICAAWCQVLLNPHVCPQLKEFVWIRQICVDIRYACIVWFQRGPERTNGAMQNTLTLAERILTARKRVRASQDDIAAVCDATRQQVGKWEHGRAVPDLIQVLRLARYTNQPLDWFTADLDLCDLPKTDSIWDSFNRSQDPLPFEPDEGLVIDLRDNSHEVYTRRDSDDTYALTG